MNSLTEWRAESIVRLDTPDITRIVADRWKEQYRKPDGTWYDCTGGSEVIYKALVALGDNPQAEDINRIIGNESWTKQECTICSSIVESLVHFVSEDCPQWVCRECLEYALGLLSPDPNRIGGGGQ